MNEKFYNIYSLTIKKRLIPNLMMVRQFNLHKEFIKSLFINKFISYIVYKREHQQS